MNVSKLIKVVVGAYSGGLGGAALGAVSGSNTPAGSALGTYEGGKSAFGSSAPTTVGDGKSALGNDYSMGGYSNNQGATSTLGDSFSDKTSRNDYSKLNNDYSMGAANDSALDAMTRRRKAIGGGGSF